MLFKAAVVTLWTFVEYFIAIAATPVSLQCSSGFSARGIAAPTPPFGKFGYATGAQAWITQSTVRIAKIIAAQKNKVVLIFECALITYIGLRLV